MSTLKQFAQRVTPPSVWNKVAAEYFQWRTGVEWYSSLERRVSARRLQTLKDKHKGERCFIIGNGPSLNKMDLSPLKNEVTFGLNRIYLLFPRLGFSTTYYVSVNRLVIEQCAQEIENLSPPKFVSWYARDVIRFTSSMMFIRDPHDGRSGFSKDPKSRIWEGATVTYVAMQIAYYMGFQTIILIGVDHSFATKGTPHEIVRSTGADPNHFDTNYFGKDFRWQLPDLETSEKFYELAKFHFEQDGREIIDATVDGKLQVFPKVDYLTLFQKQNRFYAFTNPQ